MLNENVNEGKSKNAKFSAVRSRKRGIGLPGSRSSKTKNSDGEIVCLIA
jgi:hypothetical protein